MLKVLPVRIAAAVSSLASEVLTGTAGHVDGAAVLDRLRRRMNATHAVLWICDNQGGRRVLVSGRGSAAQAAPLDFDHGGVAIQRLRRAGTVLCCLGEVTGFEDLVPDDVHSFVVAAGTSGDDCTPVLLLGWTLPVPPCVTADAVPLQIAATLLASTLAPRFGTDRQLDGYVDTSHNVTEARRAQSLLREVTRKLVTAQEGERDRIARELHDDVGQQVALLVSHLEMITPDRDLRPELDHARESLQAIASALTNLSHQLHPGKVKLIGLSNSLVGLCRDFSSKHGIPISLVTKEVPRDLAEDCGVTLYRVAQEAVRNAVKHSDATGIAVELKGALGQLTLRVRDDGKGFDPMTSQASGLGLLTMRERVELAGGVLTIEPVQPRGTAINVVVPFVAASQTATPALPVAARSGAVPRRSHAPTSRP